MNILDLVNKYKLIVENIDNIPKCTDPARYANRFKKCYEQESYTIVYSNKINEIQMVNKNA